MVKTRWLIFCVLFLVSCVLTGCKENVKDDFFIHTTKSETFSYDYNTYENGLIYVDQKNRANFLEYSSMNGVPLCNKPNCKHNDSKCTSILCMENNNPIVFKDNIYYFKSSNEIVDSEDGKSQTCKISSQCMRISLKTGEEEVFIEFNDVDPTASCSYVLNDGILYFISSYAANQFSDGTWSYSSGGGKQYLCSINLENKDFMNYGLVNDSPYAENNTIITGSSMNSVSDQVVLSGIYNNKIYMYYQYVKNQQDLIDVLSANGDLNKDVPWIYENKSFDLKTGDIAVSDLPPAVVIQENMYAYWDNEVNCYVIKTEDGKDIIAKGFKETWSPRIVNGKLWSFANGIYNDSQCFDIVSQKLYSITNETYTNEKAMTRMIDYVGRKYIVQYQSNQGTVFDEVLEKNLIGN